MQLKQKARYLFEWRSCSYNFYLHLWNIHIKWIQSTTINWPVMFARNPTFWHNFHYYRYVEVRIYDLDVRNFLQVLSWYMFIFLTVFSISQYNYILTTLGTFLYYLAVQICAQNIIIILLHWHKYSKPTTTPMKLMAAAPSHHHPHLNSQLWRFRSGACYRRSLYTTPVLSGLSGLSGPSV